MKKEINNFYRKNKQAGEIDFFREVANQLNTKFKCLFIKETHQNYVEFYSSLTSCMKIRKEISDLWIISYSFRKKEARMTFLQAKFFKKQIASPKGFKFNGDFFQYDLLSKRPLISDLSGNNFPNTILSSALSDAVGSFGVFYLINNGDVDFAFSIASELNYNNRARCRTRDKVLYFNVNSATATSLTRNNTSGNVELVYSLNADDFEHNLVNLLIGSEIQNDLNLLRFLRAYFFSLLKKDNDVNNFLTFLASLNAQELNVEEGYFDGNPNILLINIDE